MVDVVVPRGELRGVLGALIRVLMKKGARHAGSNGFPANDVAAPARAAE